MRRVFTIGQYAEMVRNLGTVDPGLAFEASLQVRMDPRGLDVIDPYRRGARAAATCAATIDDALAVILDVVVP